MGALKSKRCSRGHLLSPANTYLRKNGQRECRKCSLERSKQFQVEVRALSAALDAEEAEK
jgi:hypothetical protein